MRKGLLPVAVLSAVHAAAPAGAQCTPAWLPIGDMPVNPTNGAVTSVTEWDPDGAGPAPAMLIAGGQGLLGTDHMVAAWDGQAWMPLGNGLRGGQVRCLTTYEGTVVAGGAFEVNLGGQWAYSAVRWNGTSWSPMGTTIFDVITSLLIDDSGRLAAGTFSSGPLSLWNGVEWARVGGHTSQYGYALANYGGEVVVGGTITPLGNWNAFAVGHWTGLDWEPLGPAFGGELYSAFAMAVYQGQLIATDYAANILRRWDGATWQPMSIPGGAGPVSCLFVHNGELFAAGKMTGPRGWVSRYTGSGWSSMGETNIQTGPWFPTLGVYKGDLIFGGHFQSIGGTPALNIARWHCAPCYANCDRSGAAPVLNVNDFICFTNRFGAGDSYANCDSSTIAPLLNVNDFVCFLQQFAAGCN